MVCCSPLWHYQTVLFWNNGFSLTINSAHYIENDFTLFVARTVPRKNRLYQCVVLTRRCHSRHFKIVNDHCPKHVSRAAHFLFWGCAVATLLSRSFTVWFFPLEVFEIMCLHSQNPYINNLKEAICYKIHLINCQTIPSESEIRQIDCWPVSWMILKKKDWKLSKEIVVILAISSIKFKYLVLHVLSFHYV